MFKPEHYTGFDWNFGNQDKNWLKHEVSQDECEQVFFNQPFIVGNDNRHSITEKRYYALGQTDDYRQLFMIFTVRGTLIRVISARDMSKKERAIYEKAE